MRPAGPDKNKGLERMSDEATVDRRFATTLARGLSVLRAFRPSDNGLGNQELAERTGLPKSTVSRLTFTLQSLGYLTHTKRSEKYRLGPSVLALGNVARASVSFLEAASGKMQRLAEESGTLGLIAVRDDAKLMLAHTWRPQGTASIWLEVGHRVPVINSGSGRAFLAALSSKELQDVAAAVDKAGEGGEEDIRRNLDIARKQLVEHGFVFSIGEWAPTVSTVSVAFRSNEFGEPLVFSCGALPEVLTEERILNDVGPKLKAMVGELERAMGLSPALVNLD